MTPGPALRIDVEGHVLTVDPPEVVRIGRSSDADVRLSGESVSRAHAELRPGPRGWVLADVGSQHGTFVDDRRIDEIVVDGSISVRCGPREGGSTFTLELPAADPAPTPHPDVPVAGFADTVVLSGPMLAPFLEGDRSAPAQPRSGPDLLVVAEGHELRFPHATSLTIGRHPDSTVVLTDPVASRQHGRLDPVPGAWVFTNVSAEGTFVDGERVTSLRIEERTTLRLGHPVAGPQLAVAPILSVQEEESRAARARRGRRWRRVGAGVAAVGVVGALVAGAATLLPRSSNQAPAVTAPSDAGLDRLTSEELDSAKLATVLILAESTDASGAAVSYTGSGSILTPDGLILTNAHVAEPETAGLEERYGENYLTNPSVLLVALVENPDDSPAAPAFRARVVESDGRIDAAIIQIFATIDGDPVVDLDLPTIPIGDSDLLRTGDDVTILGFPGISQSQGVSITTGVISTFVNDPDLGPRAEIDTDARIAPGNSGGLAINNQAEIIGVPSAFFAQQGVPIVSGRIRPINVIADLISNVEQ